MKKGYKIEKPSDFKLVISDLLDFCEKYKHNNLVLALQGDLGAGKTTFVQELAKSLVVSEVVNSPTFMIMKQYELSHDLFDKLVHIDAYRFESEEEARPLGLADLIKQPHTIACVEWPEIIPTVIPEEAVWVKITIEDNQVREVTVEYKTEG